MSVIGTPTGMSVPLRVARVSVAILIAINLINYIDRYVLSSVEPLVRDAFFQKGDPNAKGQMGLLATAFLVTYMLAAPLFGWMGDRMKRWTIIGVGVVLWSLATGACGLASSFSMLLFFRILVGVGEAAWGPIAPTVIADMYTVEKRGTVLAWFNVALPVGSALGYVIGGQVAKLMNGYGPQIGLDAREGWRWAFLIVMPPGLLLGAWALFRKDPPRGAAEKVPSTHRFRFQDALLLFKIPSYLWNLAGMTLMTFAVGGMSFWMPTYIHEFRMRGGTDAAGQAQLADINLIFGGITVVTGLAGTIVGGYLGDWLRPRLKGGGAYLKLSGWAMMAAFPFFLLVLHAPFPWAWVAMGACLFLAFMNTGPTNTVIANVVPPGMRATGYAVAILVLHALGDAISPPLIGAITDRFKTDDGRGNMNLAFNVVGVTIFLAGVCWYRGARYLARDTELAPTRRSADSGSR